MSKKSRIEFEGFDEVVAKFTKLEGNIKKTTEEALKKSQRHIHQKLGVEMQKHNETFQTVKSLTKSPAVIWVGGTMAEIDVGFDISKGGLASIFLMYGTPKMEKDQKLYDAIYGSRTKKEVTEIQKELFFNEIRRLGG